MLLELCGAMRKKETRTRKNRKYDESTAIYTTERGMESRIVSFRLNEMVYETLGTIAYSENKDPSACIREAIGQYIRSKSSSSRSGSSAGPIVGDESGIDFRGANLGAWVSRSSKL